MKKLKPSWAWFEIGLIVLSLLAHLYIASRPANALMNWYSSDDGFYYFKVAANINSGLGVTFDGINRTNGFQPLWMLVCIPVFALARFDLVLPLRVLVMVSALLNAGTGILIFRLLRRFLSSWTAAVVSMVWVFLPSIHEVAVQNGMESAISAFFLALLLSLAVRKREEHLGFWKVVPIGVVGGLAILARLDNIFVVMLIGLWFVLGQVSDVLRMLIVGDVALVYIVGLLGYFFRLPAGPLYIANSASMPWHIALGFILIPLSLFIFGLYPSSAEKIRWKFLLRCVLAVGLGSGLTGIILLIIQRVGLVSALPRSVILINFAGTLVCVVGLRALAGIIYGTNANSENPPILTRPILKILIPRFFGFFIPTAILLATYMSWSTLYVGTPMPISGQIKQWWGDLPNTVYGSVHRSLPELFGFSGGAAWDIAASPLHLLPNTVAALVAGRIFNITLVILIAALLFVQRKWLLATATRLGLFPLILGLYAQILSYTSTSYIHIREWYWISEMLFMALLLGIILECAWLTLNRAKIKPLAWQIGMAILSLACLSLFGQMVIQRFPYFVAPGNQNAYLAEVRTLEASTSPGSLIGQTGGGTTAYFIKDRTIVNLDGLINSPEYFSFLKVGQGAEFLDRMGINYVYGDELMLTASDPYRQLLEGHLDPVARLGSSELYRYIPSSP